MAVRQAMIWVLPANLYKSQVTIEAAIKILQEKYLLTLGITASIISIVAQI